MVPLTMQLEAFIENFLNWHSLLEVYPLLLRGLGMTVLIALASVPAGVAAGLCVAVIYSLASRYGRLAVIAYIDLVRSVPVLVLLILIFYALPLVGIRLNNFLSLILTLVLNSSGYFGEIFRAGMDSVPAGQSDAAYSLGLSRTKAMALVVIPQAVRLVLAPLATNAFELVKSSSIGAVVALPELLHTARIGQQLTYNPTPLTAAAVLFFATLLPFAILVGRLQRTTMRHTA